MADALAQVQGAYSLVCLTPSALIAVRDPHGIRPLCLGKMRETGAWVVASEPTSFDLIDADYSRDVDPGELVIIDRSGLRSMRPFADVPRATCIFEYVYFARPDSNLDGVSVYEARKNLGRALAKEHPIDADVVIPVPDSGVPATIGYAEASGIPFELGLVRSHYVGRTFLEPQQSIRHFGVRLKLNPVSGALAGKRVVVVDDSIVRGTTSRKIVKMLRDAGAREVHMRISTPRLSGPATTASTRRPAGADRVQPLGRANQQVHHERYARVFVARSDEGFGGGRPHRSGGTQHAPSAADRRSAARNHLVLCRVLDRRLPHRVRTAPAPAADAPARLLSAEPARRQSTSPA